MNFKSRPCKPSYSTALGICGLLILLLIVMNNTFAGDLNASRGLARAPTAVWNGGSRGRWIDRINKVVQATARAKTQLQLLEMHGPDNIFTSIRPKIGKKFNQDCNEREKIGYLEECRLKLVELAVSEARVNLTSARNNHKQLCEDLQCLQPGQYKEMLNYSYQLEKNLLNKFTKKHQVKVTRYKEMNNVTDSHLPTMKPEKKTKNRILTKTRRKKRDKKRRLETKEIKKKKSDDLVKEIKDNNLVHNFSKEEIPDAAYIFLALGSNFVPTRNIKSHDHVFDTKLFSRKLAWAAHHHRRRTEGSIEETNQPLLEGSNQERQKDTI